MGNIAHRERILGGDRARQRASRPARMGERFTRAVAVNSIRDPKRTLIIYKAITTADLQCNLNSIMKQAPPRSRSPTGRRGTFAQPLKRWRKSKQPSNRPEKGRGVLHFAPNPLSLKPHQIPCFTFKSLIFLDKHGTLNQRVQGSLLESRRRVATALHLCQTYWGQ